MLFISAEDFFTKAAQCQRLPRQQEIECAKRMKGGDSEARNALIESYLPMVAGHIRRLKPEMHTLHLALSCVCALEKAVDRFNFLQDGEPFTNRLSWVLRQEVTRSIAQRP